VARWISPTSLNRRLSSAYLYFFYGKKGERKRTSKEQYQKLLVTKEPR